VSDAPPLTGILETVLYCTSANEDATRAFYRDVLGLPLTGDGFSHRVGGRRDVLLLFNADEAIKQDNPPPHGPTGPVHVCFQTTPDNYDAWKRRITDAGVAITSEITTWRDGLRSFYFDDPAGNVLEIADGDMWPP
jgi:catechol 2,3-dioxygenase-like lactoylglutathione lyase family enzyme